MEDVQTVNLFLRKLQNNLQEWRHGEIEYAAFTEIQLNTWQKIRGHGRLMVRHVVEAIQIVHPRDVKALTMGAISDGQAADLDACVSKYKRFRIEIERESSGDRTVRVAPILPATQRGVAAFVYQLAADMECRSEDKGASWIIYPDASNARVVIGAQNGDDGDLAEQFVADLIAAHQ